MNARIVSFESRPAARPIHHARGLLAVVVAAAAVAAWPGTAAAAITTTAATIDGVTSTSAPPGSVMNASVTADVSGAAWSATSVQFGSENADCINHDNESSGTGRKASFKVTAPGDPGDYDVGFTPNTSSSCDDTAGSTFTLTKGLTVTTPAANPNLPPRCGINVMLVLDESGSIETSGATEKVKSAATAFLNALSGTGAKVSITDFSTTAAQQVPYTTVTSDSIADIFDPYLKTGYKPSGWTNWEAAFQTVHQANKSTLADLVVFITDGDPTARNNPGHSPVTNLTEGDVTAMRAAATEADLVKGDGSHVLAMGVGAAVTKESSARRLTAVSGFDETPPAEFSEADFTLVTDFDKLAAALRRIAVELCQASVTVTKLVDEGDGVYRPDQGWEFTTTVSTSPGGFAWVLPTSGSGASRTGTTNDDGVTTFQWKPENATATSTVTIEETLKPGFDFVDADCKVNSVSSSGSRRRVLRRTKTTGNPKATATLAPGEYATCTVRNKITPGTIEIEKQATPQSSQRFLFGGSLGAFTLVDDGKSTSSSKVFEQLTPGTYTVSELVPEDWELTGIACVPASAATIAGTQVTITLAPAGSVTCTYSDNKVEP
ncbi:MAG TPA: vWA domain-containing protein, partial [Nocardioidaceae bacterium]